jgi:hypothetical protein
MRFPEKFKVTTTTAGGGAITLGSAASGHVGVTALVNGEPYRFHIEDANGAWETTEGIYTSAGTSFSRVNVIANSAGTFVPITLSAGTHTVTIAPSGHQAEEVDALTTSHCGGRLTLLSGDPSPAADQLAKTTVYYTPFNGDSLPLFRDAAGIYPIRKRFAELSKALATLANTFPHDVFVDFGATSAGVMSLTFLAWASNTARATALVLANGAYYRGDRRFLWVGTFMPTTTGQTEDSVLKRFVVPAYNRKPRRMFVTDITNHTYGLTTIRQWRATAGNKVEFLIAHPSGDDVIPIQLNAALNTGHQGYALVGAGLDSITVFVGPVVRLNIYTPTAVDITMTTSGVAAYRLAPGIGYHYVAALESDAVGTFVTSSFLDFALAGEVQA